MLKPRKTVQFCNPPRPDRAQADTPPDHSALRTTLIALAARLKDEDSRGTDNRLAADKLVEEGEVVRDGETALVDAHTAASAVAAGAARAAAALQDTRPEDVDMRDSGDIDGVGYEAASVLQGGVVVGPEGIVEQDDDVDSVVTDLSSWSESVDDDGDDEDTETIRTAEPLVEISAADAAAGVDIQGIPWHQQPFTREGYRTQRLQDYTNYENLEQKEKPQVKDVRRDGKFYQFYRNTRRVKCSIVHFQLRNLVWATSKHDVYLMHNNGIIHWDAAQRRASEVLNLSGTSDNHTTEPLLPVQVSTMIVRDNILVAGGFFGEVVVKNLETENTLFAGRITYDDNAITNAVDVYREPSGERRIMTSNNDCHVRVFDSETFALLRKFKFDYPINHASRQPGTGKLICAVGDDNAVVVIDGDSGHTLHTLSGHKDFSFATAWHPDGNTFATGNQDCTCRVWDVRYMGSSIAVLGGHIGAMRSLRYSSDGTFLAMSEPADFVHLYDTREYARCQEIDLFGEIAGVGFSPDDSSLFVGIFDRTYGSLLEYERAPLLRDVVF